MVLIETGDEVIAIDHDGTIVKTYDPVMEEINARHGTNLTVYDLTSRNPWDKLPITKAQFLDALDAVHARGVDFEPYDEYTVPVLKEIQDRTDWSYVLSSKIDYNLGTIDDWLMRRDIRLPVARPNPGRHYISTEEKMHHHWQVLADDNAELIPLMESYPSRTLLLFHTPTNRKARRGDLPDNVIPTDGWKDARNKLFGY